MRMDTDRHRLHSEAVAWMDFSAVLVPVQLLVFPHSIGAHFHNQALLTSYTFLIASLYVY